MGRNLTEHDVVFVVPGIMGSTLVEPRQPFRTVWSLDYEHLVDTLTRSSRILQEADLEVGKVIPYGTWSLGLGHWKLWEQRIDVYGGLVDFLTKRYKRASIIAFPYDWRKSNLQSGRLLATAIAAKKRAENIFIVAHSMGGLVAVLAMDDLRGSPALSKVRRVITIGTPYWGSAKAYRTLNEGRPRLYALLDRWFDKLRAKHPFAADELQQRCIAS